MNNDCFTVVVPGSTSNLGSGFDTVSAALSLYLTIDVETDPAGGIQWVHGWELPAEDNILDRSLRSALSAFGGQFPGLRLSMNNSIPLKRGLGSSAAAIIAGIKIAEHLNGLTLTPDQVFSLAYPLEAHPDNLAASCLGGWALSRVHDGMMRAERLASALSCRFVVAVPELTVSTRQARSILPESYSRPDAVYNLQRCGLLVHALHAGRKELLREATGDRLHQPYRSQLVPGIAELLRMADLPPGLSDALLGICISGSGSAVVALADNHCEDIGHWMAARLSDRGTSARCLTLDLDTQGARVISRR